MQKHKTNGKIIQKAITEPSGIYELRNICDHLPKKSQALISRHGPKPVELRTEKKREISDQLGLMIRGRS